MRSLLLFALFLGGCAAGPAMGSFATARLAPSEAAPAADALRSLRGSDCTAVVFGGRTRDTSVEHALRSALEHAGYALTTPLYNVRAFERGGLFESCTIVTVEVPR